MPRHTQLNLSTGKIETKNVARAKERALGTPVDTSTVGKRIKRALIG